MKIKTVRFHQAVQVGASPVSYLTPDDYMSVKGGQKFTSVEQCPEGVKIDVLDTIIIVGWSNIAYLVLDKKSESKSKKA